MSDGAVTYESRDGIAFIAIERPEKLNAITADMAEKLCECWREFNRSSDRVAVLSGSGDRAFTAGADASALGNPSRSPVTMHQAIPGIIERVDKPIVLAVSGYCYGLGLAILQAADLCVAAEGSLFAYPENRLHGIATGRIPSLVGQVPAKIVKELVFTGDPIDAQRAYEAGMINEVCAPGEHVTRATHFAERIAECGPLGVKLMKRHIDTFGPHVIPERAAAVIDEWALVSFSRDQEEGRAAYREGRPPDFQGD